MPFFSLFFLFSNSTVDRGSRYNNQVVRAVQEGQADPAGHNIPLVQAVPVVREALEDHKIQGRRRG